jgi:uncharacterized protein
MDNVNTAFDNRAMDIHFEYNGATFTWDAEKARKNIVAHDGIAFEQAVEAFFDPFLRIHDASRNDGRRDAVVGYDSKNRLLFCSSYAYSWRNYSHRFRP